jgi:hypothetical protein
MADCLVELWLVLPVIVCCVWLTTPPVSSAVSRCLTPLSLLSLVLLLLSLSPRLCVVVACCRLSLSLPVVLVVATVCLVASLLCALLCRDTFSVSLVLLLCVCRRCRYRLCLVATVCCRDASAVSLLLRLMPWPLLLLLSMMCVVAATPSVWLRVCLRRDAASVSLLLPLGVGVGVVVILSVLFCCRCRRCWCCRCCCRSVVVTFYRCFRCCRSVDVVVFVAIVVAVVVSLLLSSLSSLLSSTAGAPPLGGGHRRGAVYDTRSADHRLGPRGPADRLGDGRFCQGRGQETASGMRQVPWPPPC